MFLRGRPITMYIPSGIRSLEELPSGPPPETLSLDWVYPNPSSSLGTTPSHYGSPFLLDSFLLCPWGQGVLRVIPCHAAVDGNAEQNFAMLHSFSSCLWSGPFLDRGPQHSYGYRGRDSRSNLFVLRSGEVVYFIACVVVLYRPGGGPGGPGGGGQRHYRGHTDCVRW